MYPEYPFAGGFVPCSSPPPFQQPPPIPQPRRVLLGSPGMEIPPLLEPIRRPLPATAASHQQFTISRPVPQQTDPSTFSLTSVRRHNISTPVFPLRKSVAEMCFEEVCMDPRVVINPKRLGFIPSSSWTSEAVTFGMLVTTFFRRRNSMHCKFPYKLFNALRLSEHCPEFVDHLGVQWVTDAIFRVHRHNFARLIGVKTIEGGLFHQQGNFPSHGFVELPFAESDALSREHGMGPCDLSVVRFVHHVNELFTRFSTEAILDQCKWSGV